MTTNKPEVAGFISEAGIKKLREDEYTSDWTLYARPVRNSVTPLIRLSDYEALQAECEKLRRDAELWEDVADYVGVYQKGSAVGCQMRLLSGGIRSGAQIVPDLSPSP